MLAIVSMVAITACAPGTASSPAAEQEPPLGAITKIDSASQVKRPTDSFLPSAQQIGILSKVSMTTTGECYVKNGVKGEAKAENPSEAQAFFNGLVADRTIRSDLWGFFDERTVKTYGYSRPASVPGTISVQLPSDSSVEITRKCMDEGQKALGGHEAEQFAEPKVLPAGGPKIPLQDSRYKAVVDQWKDCMKDRGFTYENPMAAMMDRRWDGGTVSREQIAAATADVQCKIATNLVGIGTAVQSAYDQQYINSHRSELDAFAAAWDGYLRGAK